jgi:hypothetical protein
MKLLKLTECCREFGLPVRWLKDEVKAGRLPALKVGRALFFERDAIERTLAERAASFAKDAGRGYQQ